MENKPKSITIPRNAKPAEIKELVGKTLVVAERCLHFTGDDGLLLVTTQGFHYLFCHRQDSDESVSIEDITGELGDLIGSPILKADETSNRPGSNKTGDSETWTFYHFATIKGYVTVRWYGKSNGYYSESVDLCKWRAE